jgi:dolichol-phosphate mannosyltransferase
VKVVSLSRNFGHQVAVSAGLHYARGDAVVLMDADLQDPPELIPDLVAGYREGYDVVYGMRAQRRGQSWFKRATASLFYRLMKRIAVRDLPRNTGDFRLMSRRVVDNLKSLREHDRFVRGLVTWLGYHQKPLSYSRAPRRAGTTKYPLLKMVRFATNAMLTFSDLPLRMIVWAGFMLMFLGLALSLGATDVAESGHAWGGLSAPTVFLFGGTWIALGIVGLYVGRIYDEVLGRPLFVVKTTYNLPAEQERPQGR